MQIIHDVAIIGGGVVGTAIARELSRYKLNCILLEAKSDIGMGTSKANTAVQTTGFDSDPESLEGKLLKRSYPLMEKFMSEAGIPVEKIGGLLVAWTQEQFESLPHFVELSHKNGVEGVSLIPTKTLYTMEPNLKKGAFGALYVPGKAILCTFTIPLALATQAFVNDVILKFNFPVKNIYCKNNITTIIETSWKYVLYTIEATTIITLILLAFMWNIKPKT